MNNIYIYFNKRLRTLKIKKYKVLYFSIPYQNHKVINLNKNDTISVHITFENTFISYIDFVKQFNSKSGFTYYSTIPKKLTKAFNLKEKQLVMISILKL